jgi:hypothetical protein
MFVMHFRQTKEIVKTLSKLNNESSLLSLGSMLRHRSVSRLLVETKLMILEQLSVCWSSILLDCHHFLDVWDDFLKKFALKGILMPLCSNPVISIERFVS